MVVGQTPGVSLKVTPKNSEKTTTTLVNVQQTAENEKANNTGKFKFVCIVAYLTLHVHVSMPYSTELDSSAVGSEEYPVCHLKIITRKLP